MSRPAHHATDMGRPRPISLVRRLLWTALGLSLLLLLGLLLPVWQGLQREPLPALIGPAALAEPDPQLVERGAYLARAGNCAACHTARGGPAYAGGEAIATPFGRAYGGNLTPDPQHGIGLWSADAFWRALHEGRSRDGRLLNPVFPYDSFTHITREDSDALYAFLRSLPPVAQPSTPQGLRFPFNQQAALAAWQALYFEPGALAPEPARGAEWNRGAYLVRGLGHCAACHATRDPLGGIREGRHFTGGLMAGQGWYAPSLHDPAEAGVGTWDVSNTVALLKTGSTLGAAAEQQATVQGPMAEVVFHSTQHLSEADLRAMAVYLQGLDSGPAPLGPFVHAEPSQLALGEQVYRQHCIDCHGASGEGAPAAYPALAGNRTVTMPSSVNALQAILSGGFAPSTAGNPRPYGMPPYRTILTNAEIAAVGSFIRQSWGNEAGAVSTLDVQRVR
ncbi:MAG: cytochrome c [Hydrogenophaga sp.]|nr:cytochrome c [Hydrogenophaga sp.]